MTGRPPSGIPLLGGTANRGQVHRVGDTVRRPLRPTAPATHALLRHLERVGFDGAPRLLGIDDEDREVLGYVPGTAITAPPPEWALTDDALRSVADLLRRFHVAVADFDPDPHVWPPSAPAPYATGTITHNDPNLDNVVFRDGRAVALIDFDLAAPGSPVWDVAAAARLWTPLRDPVDVDDSRHGRALHRLRVFVEAYGAVDGAVDGEVDGAMVADAVAVNHEFMCAIVADGARRGVPGFVAYWQASAQDRADRTRAWLAAHAAELRAALR